MAVDIGFRHREWPFAFAWPNEQKAHARLDLVDQGRRLEQRRDAFLSRYPRHRNDDLRRAETELTAELCRRRSPGHCPLELPDVDPARDHQTIPLPGHSMPLE